MANPNEELIHKFYTAFVNKNYQTMLECYSEQIQFQDPVFETLKGNKAKAMWRMLVEKSKDLSVTFSNVSANDSSGSADWVAEYSYGKESRKIVNKVHATFTFQNGLIVSHKDSFSLWMWAGMALGATGYLTGFLPSVQNKIRKEAQSGLDLFIKRNKIVI
jgi:ketosteroid isomerase-like protein